MARKLVGQVVLEASDVQAALEQQPGTALQKHWMFWPILVAGLVAINHVVSAGEDIKDDWMQWLPLGLFLAVFAAMMVKARRRLGHLPLEGKSAEQRSMKFELDADGFSIEMADSTGRSAWSALHHYVEADSAFLLYLNPSVCHVLPKRAFSESDVTAIRALLQDHAPADSTAGGQRKAVLQWLGLAALFAATYYLMQ